MPITALRKRYQEALNDFFHKDEEKALYEVSNLGKELVLEKLGPDVLLEIHSICLKKIVEKLDPVTISRMVVNANEVLLNGIMAYAMNYYSFMELIENEKLKLEEVRGELQLKAAKLEEANEKLHEMDRLKSLFIATMSHELRTPLNSIIGFSRILMDEWAGPLNEEQKENLAIILTSGKHLLGLINDIIDISKIEAGKIERRLEKFDLADMISEGTMALTNEAHRKNLTLQVKSEHIMMRTDRKRFLQCVLNLLSNAVKFTEQGGITVNACRHGFRRIEVVISDTGIGIPQEYHQSLFTPFLSIESPLRAKSQGAGLGLYLTRRLVTNILEGELLFESVPGKGSVFTMRLPVKPRRTQEVAIFETERLWEQS